MFLESSYIILFVDVSELDYKYPRDLIAIEPHFPPRVLYNFKQDGQTFVKEIPFDKVLELFQPGDILFLNNTKVLPRRLFTKTERDEEEVLFLKHLGRKSGLESEESEERKALKEKEKEPSKGTFWQVLCSSKRFQLGKKYPLPEGRTFSLVKKTYPQVALLENSLEENYFAQHGELPIPPYILQQRKQCERKWKEEKEGEQKQKQGKEQQREGESKQKTKIKEGISTSEHNDKHHCNHHLHQDHRYYQNPWAKVEGSLAAPTASLHFEQEHLNLLRQRGVSIYFITLHIGLDTFAPLRTDSLEDHVMHKEWVSIPKESTEAFERAKSKGARVWAMGTTVVRALESWKSNYLSFNAKGDYEGETSLMIAPGHIFQSVDALLTNFHQPRSTLLALVATLFGLEEVKRAYAWAIQKDFRLFSYGDLTVWIKP